VCFKGNEIIASYSGDSIYLFSLLNTSQYVNPITSGESIYGDDDIYQSKDEDGIAIIGIDDTLTLLII
jgi:hypothetical protein